jgi:hypothetical protein
MPNATSQRLNSLGSDRDVRTGMRDTCSACDSIGKSVTG